MIVFFFSLLSALAGPMEDVEALVGVAPRVAGSPGGYQAQAYVLSELQRAGWSASMKVGPTPGSGFVQACQPGKGPAFWVLAHTDAVAPESPGAIDNAGSVAVALEVARRIRRAELPRRVCFGFTDGEELGLHGARYLVKSLGAEEKPHFVVALEFLGQGELTAMGIGEHWGVDGLRWLNGLSGVEVPYAYRIYASLFPSRERSDHRPFVEAGALGMLLLGRGESGVYWPYHTERDDLSQVDPNALGDGVALLMEMLQRGPPSPGSDPAIRLPVIPWVMPGFLVWIFVGIGVTSGLLVGFTSWRAALGGLGWSAVAAVAAGIAVIATGFGRPLYGAMSDMSHWTWWLLCFWVLLSTPLHRGGIKAGALACAWLTAGFCAIHPLLAIPWAGMAIACALATRIWPFFLLVFPFPLYLTSSALWRELVFHGVLPPDPIWWMPMKCLAMWPVACVLMALQPLRGKTPHLAFGLVLLMLSSLLFLSEPFSGVYFEREVLTPSR